MSRRLLLLLHFLGFCCGARVDRFPFPTILNLERALRLPSTANLDSLRSRDRLRHHRILQQQQQQEQQMRMPSVVNFPVEGSSDTAGLYFTRVKLGSPPTEFYVQIDTGSDILWVTCFPCNNCPTTSGLNIQLESFDPGKSSSASLLSCSNKRCSSGLQPSSAICQTSSQGSVCGYAFQYGDGSGTSGYYISDVMHFQTVTSNQVTTNLSANVIFGCSNYQSGGLTNPDIAVDGIFGFGKHDLSIISQLSSHGVAPKVFSHCLRGSANGGGILVLGEVVESGIVYTPLVQDQPHYSLNLQNIAVNGQILPIDASIFATSTTRGTIVDSGTTLAYLVEEAYDPFVNAVTSSVSQYAQPFISGGLQCFIISNGVDNVFPLVTLIFEGGASMILKPKDYLVQKDSFGNTLMWCMGWQKNQEHDKTILGDLVLKDKILVYDLARQRIGWANYDCSQSVNVSVSGKNEYINDRQHRVGCSPSQMVLQYYVCLVELIMCLILISPLHL